MNWKPPNQLTIARIGLAGAFFVLLGLYEQGTQTGRRLLDAAFVLYIVAGITDVLDGWIARKYNWTSAFGRITDPFVDKVLVVGAFAMLSGANFAMPSPVLSPAGGMAQIVGDIRYWWHPRWAHAGMTSCVQTWMVVVIMAREFIVSAVRGYSESRGIKFPATPAGKIKMFIQSVAICTVLYQMANLEYVPWAITLKAVLVWLAVAATVASGLAYVGKTWRILKSDEHAS